MSKKTTVTGYHLVVEPKRGFYGFKNSVKQLENECKAIASAIKRHVDDVQYVEIVSEKDFECEHCGAMWTEESDKYNGGCCDEDEKNAPVIPQFKEVQDMVNALSIRSKE